jgi:hypothetical protein
MYKQLLSRLEIAFKNGLRGRLWLQKLISLLGICFVVFSPNHSKASISVTKEQAVLEKRIESVRDNLLKQDKANQDKADSNQIAWYDWNNWRDWGNY